MFMSESLAPLQLKFLVIFVKEKNVRNKPKIVSRVTGLGSIPSGDQVDVVKPEARYWPKLL